MAKSTKWFQRRLAELKAERKSLILTRPLEELDAEIELVHLNTHRHFKTVINDEDSESDNILRFVCEDHIKRRAPAQMPCGHMICGICYFSACPCASKRAPRVHNEPGLDLWGGSKPR